MPVTETERIHPASPRRRQEARQQGHVAKSRDLATAAVLLGGLLILAYGGGSLIQFFGRFTRDQLSGRPWNGANQETLVAQWQQLTSSLGSVLLPLFGLLVLVGLLAHLGQTGFLFVPARLAPQWSRMNPVETWKRLFSLAHASSLGIGLLKAVAVVSVIIWSLWSHRAQWMALGTIPAPALAKGWLEILLWTCIQVACVLLVLGVFDYAWQRWRYEQQLRMTDEELREELRQQAGDPQLARTRRERQRALAVAQVSDIQDKPFGERAA